MGRKSEYDVVVIGAGHNGLVCANYLARDGLKVLVLERRHIVGGAAATEEPFPGYRIDAGSAIHVLIHDTPVIEELELEKYGLEYIDLDPFAYAAFTDGTSYRYYRDLDRTCAELERISPHDAEAYRKFIVEWQRINEMILPTFQAAPELPRMTSRAPVFQPLSTLPMLKPDVAHRTTHLLMSSYAKLLDSTFESEYVRAPLAFMSAQALPPPDQLGTGNFAGWHALYHSTGVKRPRGGSGALTEALAKALHDRGGEVRTGVEVRRIDIRDGKVRGVVASDGTGVSARAVISAIPVTKALLGLVPAEHLDAELQRQLRSLSISNSVGMYVRGAASALPSYLADPGDTPGEHHRGLQLLCPTVQHLRDSHRRAERGDLPEEPAIYILTPTVTDPSLAPEGSHTVYFWGQYYPCKLSGGKSWAQLRQAEAERLVQVAAKYAPNLPEILGREQLIRTPQDLADDLGLPNGNLMHLDMSLDQLFFMRPLPSLSNYRTPIQGLYLTGAGTHPGGGIQGAPGMNAAHAVSSDLRKGRKWVRNAVVAGTAAAVAVAAARRVGASD